MCAKRISRYKIQELIVSERLTDISSPATQRMIEAYQKSTIRGEGEHKLLMGSLTIQAAELNDLGRKPPEADDH